MQYGEEKDGEAAMNQMSFYLQTLDGSTVTR